MKMTVQLGEVEIRDAVLDYLKGRGFGEVSDLKLSAEPAYDYMDRPTGGHTISATARVALDAGQSAAGAGE